MQYIKKYACLYGDTEFDSQELAEIGRFKAQLTKAASMNDTKGIVQLFRNEFSGMDDECFDRVNRYFEYVSLYDGGHEKTAKVPIESILSALALGLAATPLAEKAIGAISDKFAHKSALKKIMQLHPELRNDPYAPQYFQALVDFAPDIAKNALVAGNIMKEMHRIGPSSLTANRIRDLIGMQSEMPRPTTGLSNLSEPVRGLADDIASHKRFIGAKDLSRKRYPNVSFWSDDPTGGT